VPAAEAPAPSAPAAPATQPAAPAAAAPDAVPSASATSAAVAPPAEPVVSERPVERAVPLQRAPEAASAMLQMALDRHVSRARISLRPAELGGIEVQLKSTAAGVSARIVADSPEAARLLAAAGEELRRSLESRDVTLVSLEIAVTGEDALHRDAPRNGLANELGDTSTSAREGDAEGDADPAAPDTVHSVVELPGGLLVDVLA
jgi:flagellar hook-length control protein FliK